MNLRLLFPFILVYGTGCLLVPQSTWGQCDRRNDSLELVKLYNATKGPMWTNTWHLEKPITEWYGVKTNVQGCVTDLLLFSNKLEGTIPNVNLPNLSFLHLYDNQLSGDIPNFNLPNLTDLQVFFNRLNGTIPNFNLPKLKFLHLGQNQFNGTVPNFNLPSLTFLSLSDNDLIGAIPNFNLPNLTELLLNGNALSGSVPNLNLPNLKHLRLHKNQLTSLPAFTLLSKMGSTIGTYDSLNFYQNHFSFEDIRPNLGLINKMGAHSKYAPQDSIYRDTTIRLKTGQTFKIDLGIDDTLTTNLYQWYKNGQTYRTAIDSNKLIISSLKTSDAGTYWVKVTNPDAPKLTLVSHLIRLHITAVDTNSCRYRDSLELVKLYNATDGPNWTTPWKLNEAMNTWTVELNNKGCVTCIDLDGDPDGHCRKWHENPPGNNLKGNLPELGNGLKSLEFFNINGNKGLQGVLPENIGNLSGLISLWVRRCNLTGPFPKSFGQLPSLVEFDLGYNPLNISIDPDISDMKKLRSIIMDNCGLFGLLPESLSQLSTLARLNVNSNKLSGNVSNLYNKLANIYAIDVSNNQLTSFPDLSTLSFINTNPFSKSQLNLQINKLTFEHILPNMPLAAKVQSFTYAPQDSIYHDTTILRQVGQSLNIDLGIDDTVKTNRYQWYKNGQIYGSAIMGNELAINNLKTTDTGTYRVRVNNPAAPALTLYSKAIRLQVVGCADNPNAKLNSSSTRDTICPNTSLTLSALGGGIYKWSTGQTTSSINLNVTQSQNYQVTITDANNCPTTLSKSIVLATLPTASINTAPTAICPSQPLNLTATTQNGAIYQWQRNGSNIGTSSTQSSLQITQGGIYTVQVSNALGCKATSSGVLIKDGAVPQAEISANSQVLCVNSSLTLNASTSSDAQYQWLYNGNSVQGPNTNSSYQATQAGNYILKVTSVDGCGVSSVTFTISSSNLSSLARLSSSTAGDTLCPKTDLSLTASGGSSYRWNTGQTTANISINVIQSQTYQVSITDANNCSVTLSKDIVIAGVPSSAISSNGSQICTGQSLELRGNVQTGVSFEWFRNGQSLGPPNINHRYNINQAGTYSLRVRNKYGCTASSAELNIQQGTPPMASISALSKIICAGGKLSLSANAVQGAQYQWFRNELGVQGPSENRNFEATQAGDYKVRVSLGAACATTSVAWTLQQNPGTNSIKISLSPQRDTLCPGDSIRLTASGGQRYQWNNGSSSASIVVKPRQNSAYTVEVRDEVGCTTTLRQNITLATVPNLRLQVQEQNCNQHIVTMISGGKAPYRYRWSNGANSSAIEVRGPGQYELVLEDAQNCQVKASIQVDSFGFLLEPPVVLSPTCGEKNGSITLQLNPQRGNYTIRWLPQNEGEGDNPRTQLEGGKYQAIIQDDQDCMDSIAINMEKVTDCAKNFIIFNSFSPNGDGVNEKFVIKAKPSGACPNGILEECYPNNELIIINRWSEIVYRKQGYGSDWRAEGLPKGAYFFIFYPNRNKSEVVIKGALTLVK